MKTQAKSRPHNLAYIHRDRGYQFTDRDPKMEQLCDLIDKSDMSVYAITQKVANMTHGAYRVSESTIANWLNGKTRRPQNFTMTWVGYAIGFELTWRKIR